MNAGFRPSDKGTVFKPETGKLYQFNPGSIAVLRAWQGLALETLIYHEMRVFNETSPATRNHHTFNWMI